MINHKLAVSSQGIIRRSRSAFDISLIYPSKYNSRNESGIKKNGSAQSTRKNDIKPPLPMNNNFVDKKPAEMDTLEQDISIASESR